MIPLALQLYEERGGPLIADLSDATDCVIDNGRHGFRSLTCFVPMPLELAFAISEQGKAKWLSLNYGAGVVWEGRVEDPNVIIAEDGTGLAVTAFGAWRSLFDVPYTALWSKSGTAGFREVLSTEVGGIAESKFNYNNNNRVYITTKKGATYGGGARVGAMIYELPDGGSREMAGVQFRFNGQMPVGWSVLVRTYSDFGSQTTIATIAGTGAVFTRGYHILSLSGNQITFDLLVPAGTTETAEDGVNYFSITNFRLVTAITNRVNTTLSSAIAAPGSQTVTVASTANMHAGQHLVINTGAVPAELITVTSVDSATTFTATIVDTYSSGNSVKGFAVYADEIISDLVSHVTAVNPDQLSDSTALIESPGLDLLDESYEDAWPGDIATKLAGLGDNQSPPRLWDVGVWEGQRLHFRPRGSDSQVWAVDADELTVNSTLELLRNSMYASYQDANNRTLRTAVADDATSQAQYGITRRGVVSASTTSATQAGKHRDAALEDGKTIRPRSELQPDYLMDQTGAIAPKWMARAGQTMNIRNLPPTLGSEVDRIRTFLLEENSYDVMGDELTPVPEEPVASLEVLVARREEGF